MDMVRSRDMISARSSSEVLCVAFRLVAAEDIFISDGAKSDVEISSISLMRTTRS